MGEKTLRIMSNLRTYNSNDTCQSVCLDRVPQNRVDDTVMYEQSLDQRHNAERNRKYVRVSPLVLTI